MKSFPRFIKIFFGLSCSYMLSMDFVIYIYIFIFIFLTLSFMIFYVFFYIIVNDLYTSSKVV